MKRRRIEKPSFFAYQRIILGKAECDYCGLPQSEWFPGLSINIEKTGKIRCLICTYKIYGLEVPEDVIQGLQDKTGKTSYSWKMNKPENEKPIKENIKKSCWECRYQDLKGITFLGRCLWFKKHNMEVKEIPPHKVYEGCKHFVKK